MQYREQPVSDKLRTVAACTWSLQTCEAVSGFSVRPDGCIDVILWPDGKLRVTGAMTSPQVSHLPAASLLVGVRFLPGVAASLLGVPVDQLTDQTVLLEDLKPRSVARELQDQLATGSTSEHQQRVLASHLERLAMPLNPVQRAIAHMTDSPGAIDLATLADQACLSPRQFRRRCLEESGLTPQLLARILRFQRALACAVRGTYRTWTDVAAHCGYFDQAHLIRDFQKFAGASPVSVLSKARAFFAD